ncbi:Sulfate-transporting ATPase [Syntrophobotulus glycolicus DSM 8271]|uniref:Sulfate-transporting ATPase n=1 Tax=Syntrophobotulus glycolicus (strain DSM 8271 / FlGlyR) TaxID=645991 RepID=F0SW05_SYNGF|nr:ATP-binding cassette domain-containing protein [Syntrophobotulus glycolicus]ADY56789.1 Sulfate-transporting ATPase [Syntrophobotulus glycolicus DSM 8271]
MRAPLFEVSNLNVQAGGFKLQDITFSLESKDYLVILGPTGCGKTIMLETLAGLRKAKSGKVFLQGEEISAWPPEMRGFGFAYQDSLLYPFLTVKENILFAAKARRKHKEHGTLKRVSMLAEAMGITHLLDCFPLTLSGGEKQRVSLARAILVCPPVLLLDEPLSALDPQKRDALRSLLQDIHKNEGMGIIHVTHDFKDAMYLADQVLVMNQGKILQQGSPLTVFNKPNSLWVADFLQNKNIVSGKIKKIQGTYWFENVELNWSAGPLAEDLLPENMSDELFLMLQAGQIQVSSKEDCFHSKKISWNALIEKVIINSSYVGLTCRGNGCWHAVLSRNEWERISARAHDEITLSIDVEDIHLIANL